MQLLLMNYLCLKPLISLLKETIVNLNVILLWKNKIIYIQNTN